MMNQSEILEDSPKQAPNKFAHPNNDSQFLIAPSILSADFARLGEEVEKVIAAGADVVHFDVMDNHYVPNLTLGSMICQALRDYGVTAPIDVHLMVSPVDSMIEQLRDVGRQQREMLALGMDIGEVQKLNLRKEEIIDVDEDDAC